MNIEDFKYYHNHSKIDRYYYWKIDNKSCRFYPHGDELVPCVLKNMIWCIRFKRDVNFYLL